MFLLSTVAIAFACFSLSKQADFKVINVEKCPVMGNPTTTFPWSIKLENVDNDGFKKATVEVDLRNADFTEDINFQLNVDKYSDGDWEMDVYTEEANLCESIRKYVLPAWEKMLDSMSPRPANTCSAQRALYKLKDFEIMKTDVQIPPLKGQIRATMRFFDQRKNNVFCGAVEMEVSE